MPCSEIAPHWSPISLALATLVCGAAAAGPSAARPDSSLLSTSPFVAGESGYRIFRIPAIGPGPNRSVHAFAEGRVEHCKTQDNIDVVLCRSLDGGRTWPHVTTLWRGPSAYTAMIRSHDGFGNLLVGCVKDTFQQIAFVRSRPPGC